ncbi:MAG: hypothetical protein JRM86_02840 [Nitrososphaerota archaeon]|jgi:hypothetical protein|nr:hypothetical protein [Nitrososphaerota archaeon]MDG6967246.1 hypothetical protein [Nitrososphaerota archaeon]MDG6977891.1 hypothetical protein [Nitrososphaerota archaeon]MDG7005851.1 hypothetical protein [Nitrososphaerota archaeon]
MITVALLGAVGAVAFSSIRGSGSLLSSSSQGAAREDGVLLALVSVQANSSGTFAWVYDYGWVAGTVSAAYLDGGLVKWSSSCGGAVEPGRACAFSVPAAEQGEVSLVFGAKTLDFQA